MAAQAIDEIDWGLGGEGITLDDSQWPLVVISFHYVVTDQEYARYLKAITHPLEKARLRKERVIYVMDASASPSTPMNQQLMQGKWMRENAELIKQVSAGAAFVITSAVTRFILSNLFILSPMTVPYKVFADVHSATRWAQQRLREAPPVGK